MQFNKTLRHHVPVNPYEIHLYRGMFPTSVTRPCPATNGDKFYHIYAKNISWNDINHLNITCKCRASSFCNFVNVPPSQYRKEIKIILLCNRFKNVLLHRFHGNKFIEIRYLFSLYLHVSHYYYSYLNKNFFKKLNVDLNLFKREINFDTWKMINR